MPVLGAAEGSPPASWLPDGERRLAAPAAGCGTRLGQICSYLEGEHDVSRSSGSTRRRFGAAAAAGIALRTPRRYLGAFDAESGCSVLLLEDVAAAPGGARVGDNVAGCSRPEAEAAVRRLAGYQAAWWARPELEALGWLASYGEGAGRRQELYQQLWPAYCAKFGDRIPAPVREVGSRFGAHVARLWRRLGAPPQTIVHGDFRLDNLLFGPPPVDGTLPVTAIDWQATARGRGAADVAYFAGVCLPPDDRRAWERGLVRAYRAALLAGGVGQSGPGPAPSPLA